MRLRIGFVGAMAGLVAGCREPPGRGDAMMDGGDAVDVDVVSDDEGADAGSAVGDRPDEQDVGTDRGTIDVVRINILSDPRNCGARWVHCGSSTPEYPCVDGRCVCPGNRAGCGTEYGCLFDLDTDSEHCGSCDVVCASETHCLGARCVPCPERFASCGMRGLARCSVSLDGHDNCGACGHACASDERCVDQTCQPCPTPITFCPGTTCLDIMNDSANCGGCFNRCPLNFVCTLGRCTETPCASAGFRHCDATSTACISVLADPQNCGGCGARCLDGPTNTAVCVGGECVRTCHPGFASCGSDRSCSTELAFDDDHCGSCDVHCGAFAHCIGGVCTSLEARPLAPLSPIILGVQRPRFRWERAPGVDGVRLQLCAERSCMHIESTRDLAADEYRPDVALSPGVHFWRLFARRGASVSPSPSPVWEFVVPPVDTGREVVGLLRDIDGDGVEDEFADVWGTTVRHSLAPGEYQRVVLTPVSPSPGLPSGTERESVYLRFGGDIDGDGFGDLVGEHSWTRVTGFSVTIQPGCTTVRGGAPRFASTFVDVAVAPSFVSAFGYGSTTCQFVFDLNGDGHGDIASSTQLNRSDFDDRVRFGTQSGWTTPASGPVWAFPFRNVYPVTTWGDFNGDGRMDLLHVTREEAYAFITVEVRIFARGHFDSSLPFPRCADGSLSPRLTRDLLVLDANRDGIDDVSFNPGPAGAATFFGGPDGFTSCLLGPTPR